VGTRLLRRDKRLVAKWPKVCYSATNDTVRAIIDLVVARLAQAAIPVYSIEAA
jgi:hypothetical protein